MHARQVELKKDASFFQPKSWTFWRNLIMYFCIFSVVGHWMEAGYRLFIKWGIPPGALRALLYARDLRRIGRSHTYSLI